MFDLFTLVFLLFCGLSGLCPVVFFRAGVVPVLGLTRLDRGKQCIQPALQVTQICLERRSCLFAPGGQAMWSASAKCSAVC